MKAVEITYTLPSDWEFDEAAELFNVASDVCSEHVARDMELIFDPAIERFTIQCLPNDLASEKLIVEFLDRKTKTE